ncbi:MAG: very short patch repair endonuclease [Tagaea sp. CACIAM 22H2]|nr:very short patch repair endonuclease [Tagaea sp. CACIAM 22H2]
MVDRISVERRSALMSRVPSKNTTPEKTVRSIVHRLGFRFRLHRRDLPGTPDLVFPSLRAVIFVHGCFWHRHAKCRKASTPKSNTQFWSEKFLKNVRRDSANKRHLRERGWHVLVAWECQLKKPARLKRKIEKFLNASRASMIDAG